jgi:hypothetical protein
MSMHGYEAVGVLWRDQYFGFADFSDGSGTGTGPTGASRRPAHYNHC